MDGSAAELQPHALGAWGHGMLFPQTCSHKEAASGRWRKWQVAGIRAEQEKRQ